MSRVVWLAGGLAPTVTGVERLALTLASVLLEQDIVTPSDVRVHVEPGTQLEDECRALGLSCVAPGLAATRGDGSPVVVHNFGRELRAARAGSSYLYTVHDWGPFRDRGMPVKARLAWTAAITLGHARATDVHYVNARPAVTRPAVVPRARSWFVCTGGTTSSGSLDVAAPELALFVGTATTRKRLDLIARIGGGSAWPIELAGQGTETFQAPNVHGLGRVGEAQLEDLYRRAACLLLVSSYEGFGIPILEAPRRGIHSVVSREVLDTLPGSLRPWCQVLEQETPPALASAIERAVSARGGARFEEDLLEPLVDFYRRRLPA